MVSLRKILRMLRPRRYASSASSSGSDNRSFASSSTPPSSRSVSFADADLWPFIDDDVAE